MSYSLVLDVELDECDMDRSLENLIHARLIQKKHEAADEILLVLWCEVFSWQKCSCTFV